MKELWVGCGGIPELNPTAGLGVGPAWLPHKLAGGVTEPPFNCGGGGSSLWVWEGRNCEAGGTGEGAVGGLGAAGGIPERNPTAGLGVGPAWLPHKWAWGGVTEPPFNWGGGADPVVLSVGMGGRGAWLGEGGGVVCRGGVARPCSLARSPVKGGVVDREGAWLGESGRGLPLGAWPHAASSWVVFAYGRGL